MGKESTKAQYLEILRSMIADATRAREILAGGLEGEYTKAQIAAAERVLSNAFSAADRLYIYEVMDEVEALLAEGA